MIWRRATLTEALSHATGREIDHGRRLCPVRSDIWKWDGLPVRVVWFTDNTAVGVDADDDVPVLGILDEEGVV